MNFDILAFADYSGSASLSMQKRHIFLATAKKSHDAIKITGGYTRGSLRKIIERILHGADRKNRRVLFGFDHNYSFPDGFIQCLCKSDHISWRRFIRRIYLNQKPFSDLGQDPRNWATRTNHWFTEKYNISPGPFWGPHFVPLRKPAQIFELLPFSEKRMIEQKLPRMKSIFQLGGAGSVGLQSLYGLSHLANIVSFCESNRIALHCWPYDGIHIPDEAHVMIEVYPGFYNDGPKSDQNDACSTANYFLKRMQAGNLSELFHVRGKINFINRMMREGWVPGI